MVEVERSRRAARCLVLAALVVCGLGACGGQDTHGSPPDAPAVSDDAHLDAVDVSEVRRDGDGTVGEASEGGPSEAARETGHAAPDASCRWFPKTCSDNSECCSKECQTGDQLPCSPGASCTCSCFSRSGDGRCVDPQPDDMDGDGYSPHLIATTTILAFTPVPP